MSDSKDSKSSKKAVADSANKEISKYPPMTPEMKKLAQEARELIIKAKKAKEEERNKFVHESFTEAVEELAKKQVKPMDYAEVLHQHGGRNIFLGQPSTTGRSKRGKARRRRNRASAKNSKSGAGSGTASNEVTGNKFGAKKVDIREALSLDKLVKPPTNTKPPAGPNGAAKPIVSDVQLGLQRQTSRFAKQMEEIVRDRKERKESEIVTDWPWGYKGQLFSEIEEAMKQDKEQQGKKEEKQEKKHEKKQEEKHEKKQEEKQETNQKKSRKKKLEKKLES